MLANVQSLRKKTDELQAMVKFQPDYRNVCVMAFTETWLSEGDSDSSLRLDDFGVPIRMDRDAMVTGKAQGGGLCFILERTGANLCPLRRKCAQKTLSYCLWH